MEVAIPAVKGADERPRRQRARATRRAIVAAASAEFAEAGYHGATMAAIARRSGVAVQTVYFVFHTKAELLGAAIDTAVLGEERSTPPPDSGWWAAMVAEPRADEALRAFVTGATGVLERASVLSEVARVAAMDDPDARKTHEFHEGLRLDGYRTVVEMLAEKGRLRAGLEVENATDVLLTMLGPATYVGLTSGRGWSHERTTAWLRDAVPLLLLE